MLSAPAVQMQSAPRRSDRAGEFAQTETTNFAQEFLVFFLALFGFVLCTFSLQITNAGLVLTVSDPLSLTLGIAQWVLVMCQPVTRFFHSHQPSSIHQWHCN